MPLVSMPVSAVAPPEIRAVRVAQPPVVDGRIDDAEWADAPVHAGPGYDDETGAPGPERSEYRLTYDDRFIYFAARLSDRQPNRIKATAFRSNVSLSGDDYVGLYIDPFGTFSDGNNFEINPQGATNIRVNGGRAAKREWLGEMEARARRTPDGWEAEARIPWSVMRLPGAGRNDLRVNFYRAVSRTQRAYQYQSTANGQIASTPIWRDVEVPHKANEHTVKLLPYAYGGYEDRRGVVANSGLDLKYGLTDDLDLIGSINPDFRNIENQVLSVDFSYFERLAGETRPFFLEGAGYFQTSQDAPLFASQRIRSFDAGLKAYGKIGDKTQVAVLNARDFGVEDALVGSVRQNLGPRTNLTLAGTRLVQPGRENGASFVGASHGWGPFSAFFQHQSTRDTIAGQGRRVNTGMYYSQDGWNVGGEWVEVTPNFLPRLGFAPRRNLRGFSGNAGYTKIVPRGPIMEWEASVGGVDWRKFDGSNFTRGVNGSGSITLRDGTDFDFGFNAERFEGNDDRTTYLDVEFPRGDPYRNVGIFLEGGRLAGRSYQNVAPRVNLRPLPRLQLTGSYQAVRHFEVSDQTILTANYDLNLADSVSGRVIRQGSRTSWYVAFRRAGNRGAEYYVILGEPRPDINRPFQGSLVLKAVFPLDWRL